VGDDERADYPPSFMGGITACNMISEGETSDVSSALNRFARVT